MKYLGSLAVVTLLTLVVACDDDSTETGSDASASVVDASSPEPHDDADVPLPDAGVPDASLPDAADAAADADVVMEDGSVEPAAPWALTFPGEYEAGLVVLGDEVWSLSQKHNEWKVTLRRLVAGSVADSWELPGSWSHISTDGQAVFVLVTLHGVMDVLGETLGEAGKQALLVLRMERDGTVAWRHVFLGNPDVQPLGFAADPRGNVVFGYVSGDISVNHTDEWSHGLVELDAQSGDVVDGELLVDLKQMVMRTDGSLIISGMLLPGEHFGEHENESEEIETYVASRPRDSLAPPFAVFWQGHSSAMGGIHEGDPIINSSDDDIYSFTRLSGRDGSVLWTYAFPMSEEIGVNYYHFVPGLEGDLQIYGHYENELHLSASLTLAAPGHGGTFFLASLDGATGVPKSAMAMPGDGFGWPGSIVTLPGEACPLASGSYAKSLTLGGIELPEQFELTGFIVSLCP